MPAKTRVSSGTLQISLVNVQFSGSAVQGLVVHCAVNHRVSLRSGWRPGTRALQA
jgi:hypothetical protein